VHHAAELRLLPKKYISFLVYNQIIYRWRAHFTCIFLWSR